MYCLYSTNTRVARGTTAQSTLTYPWVLILDKLAHGIILLFHLPLVLPNGVRKLRRLQLFDLRLAAVVTRTSGKHDCKRLSTREPVKQRKVQLLLRGQCVQVRLVEGLLAHQRHLELFVQQVEQQLVERVPIPEPLPQLHEERPEARSDHESARFVIKTTANSAHILFKLTMQTDTANDAFVHKHTHLVAESTSMMSDVGTLRYSSSAAISRLANVPKRIPSGATAASNRFTGGSAVTIATSKKVDLQCSENKRTSGKPRVEAFDDFVKGSRLSEEHLFVVGGD